MKYLVCPGIVISKSDGDKHYISASDLIRLYKVNPLECKIVNSRESSAGLDWSKYIILRPRTDGNYDLIN
jgi:hypothetical protein